MIPYCDIFLQGDIFVRATLACFVWIYLFSSVTNNFHSNSKGRLISTHNKLIIFSLSVSTLLFAIFILLYHVKPRFHVNDLFRNRIREKRTQNIQDLDMPRHYLT